MADRILVLADGRIDGTVCILAGLTDRPVEAVVTEYAGASFSRFKEDLAEATVAVLAPIAAERARLLAEPGYLEAILRQGAERARALAGPVLRDVLEIVGMLRV